MWLSSRFKLIGSCPLLIARLSGMAGKARTSELLRIATPNPKSIRFEPAESAVELLKGISTVEIKFVGGKTTAGLETIRAKKMMANLGSLGIDCTALVGKSFVAVNVAGNDDLEDGGELWEAVQDALESGLAKDIEEDRHGLMDSEIENQSSESGLKSLEEEIEEVLNTHVRPNLHSDGGDVELRGVENGIVKLRLVGSCRGCPSSTVTMKFGIKNLLTRMFEEVKEVEQVFDESDIIEGKGEGWTG